MTQSGDERPGPKAITAVELKEQIEAERLGRPFLVHRDAESVQQIVVIDEGADELWLGRSAAATISLPFDPEVSQLHAKLDVVGGDCTLIDDGLSRNGSYVNEERVGGRRRLRDGDIVRIGKTRLLFRSPVLAAGQPVAESTVISSDLGAIAHVSPAQRRVLVALCGPFKEGASFASPATNQEIGEALHLSVDAVKTHLRALFERFELGELPQNQKRLALVQRALQTGLVSERDL